jgi:hypothetical protein
LVPWRLSTSVTQKSDSSCPKATCCWSTSLTRGAWQIGPEWIWGAALGFDNRTLRFFAHASHFWFHWLLLIPSWYPHVVIGATNDMQTVELFFHHHDIHQQHHHVGTNCVCVCTANNISFFFKLQLARGPGSCELALDKQRRTHVWWSGKWFLCTCSQFEQLCFFSAGLGSAWW